MSIDISTCSEHTDFDTKLEIFKADKTTSNYNYNDDSPYQMETLESELREVTLEAGYYYIVVDGYNGETGNFELTVTNSTSLRSTSLNDIEEKSNLNLSKEDDFIKIFPNPTSDKLYVISDCINAKIELIDISGKTIHSDIIKYQKHLIDLSSMPEGIYLVRISSDKKVITQQVTKIK